MSDTTLDTLVSISRETDAGASNRREARRQAMMVAATELFCTKGYGATSLSEVVKQSGGSLSTLYDLFGNKAGLFRAIVEDRCRGITELFQRDDINEMPVEQALGTFACILINHTMDDDTMAALRTILAESIQFPELGHLFYESGPEPSKQAVANYLAEQTKRGRLVIDNPRRAAEDFCSLVCGDAKMRGMCGLPTFLPGITGEIQAQHAVEVFLRAYGPR
ncbi:TetR/AcrR family transcriptional regulator [Lacibacterium aquatile]|uniref:TetR/AcrR family transcriptional regulator n=1 Tax=Lacibacterium aquatile TaxID=1168082 RepID=A0ABW5DMC9_9PROT